MEIESDREVTKTTRIDRSNILLRSAILLALLIGLPALVSSCDDEQPADGDGDSDTDVDGDTDGDADPGQAWTNEVVDTDDVGLFSSLDVAPDGTVGVVHFAFTSYRDGECDEFEGAIPPINRFPLLYTYLSAGATEWQTESVTNEEVSDPIHLTTPVGVSFRFSPTGTPSAAIFGGEPFDVLCSSNDVILGTRSTAGAWDFDVVVTDSGSAPPSEEEYCSADASVAGYTVGSWPALAYSSTGDAAILYRDTHFGGMQSDEIRRSDAELAIQQGGWSNLMLECGNSGGENNAAIFDSEDRFVGAHRVVYDANLVSMHGLWAHRLQADGTWLKVMLTAGQVDLQESSLTAGPDGSISLIYYDPSSQHPVIAELTDTVRFIDGWQQNEFGNNTFNEGQFPTIATSPGGTLAVAYYRCARQGEQMCDVDHDALIFAWRTESGVWRSEVVDEGGGGYCGTYASLGFGSDNTAYISYVCVRPAGGSEFISELKVATRRPL